MSKAYPDGKILMFIDKAGWRLNTSNNLPIEFLTQYSFELNPSSGKHLEIYPNKLFCECLFLFSGKSERYANGKNTCFHQMTKIK